MPFVLKPGRNKTLALAYELLAADAKKAKKAAKQEAEPEAPKTAKKAAKKSTRGSGGSAANLKGKK